MARLGGVSPSRAIASLRTLEDLGLVTRRVVGRSDQWSLNAEHAVTALLVPLFEGERELRPRMLAELRNELARFPIERALLFGSMARGDETDESDLDVFIEVRGARAQQQVKDHLLEVQVRFLRKYWVHLEPLVYTRAETHHPPNLQLLANIERDGRPLGLV